MKPFWFAFLALLPSVALAKPADDLVKTLGWEQTPTNYCSILTSHNDRSKPVRVFSFSIPRPRWIVQDEISVAANTLKLIQDGKWQPRPQEGFHENAWSSKTNGVFSWVYADVEEVSRYTTVVCIYDLMD